MWEGILRLFGIKKSITTDEQQSKNANYASRYKDISDINFDALFAQRLSTKATSDSELVVDKDNKRAELLSEVGLRVWKR